MIGVLVQSQTKSRQSGGMIPSASALAIMPRCLLSARRIWQRLQSTRRFTLAFVPSLPLLMWSTWHLLRGSDHRAVSLQYGPWQRPESRSHTWRRVSFHTSRGCRFLGIVNPLPCRAAPRPTVPRRAVPYHAQADPHHSRRSDLHLHGNQTHGRMLSA